MQEKEKIVYQESEKDILGDEKERLIELKNKISQDKSKLPRGSLVKKKRGNNYYFYRVYRQGKKVKFKYVGKVGSSAAKILSDKINRRKKLEERLQIINKELKDIKRSLK